MKKQDSTCSSKVNKYNAQERDYYIVEFEDGLQVIPHNWLIDNKKAFWPPFTDWKTYYNSVKKMQEPLNDWKTFIIEKIIGSASTFARAMDKLSMAEKTSDISTDSDSDVAKIKRRRHARKEFSNEGENSESDGKFSTNKHLSLPMPPQARCGKKSASNISSSSKTRTTQPDIDNQENIDVSSNSSKRLPPLPMPPQSRYGKKSASNIGFSKTRAIQPDIDDQENIDGSSDSNKQLSPLSMPPQARYGKRSASNIASSSKTRVIQPDIDARNAQRNIKSDANLYLTRYKSDMIAENDCNSFKVMLSSQQDILKLVVENNLRGKRCETMLQNVVEKITNRNCTTSISDLINSDTDFHPEYLPAQTVEDFYAAEDKWKMDKEYRENVLRLFAKCKGTNVKNTTYTLMGTLMSDNVAMRYSWTGAKQNKEKFSKSRFHTVLQTTIMQMHNDATLQGIKKCITDWLRHAKERHTRQHLTGNESTGNESTR